MKQFVDKSPNEAKMLYEMVKEEKRDAVSVLEGQFEDATVRLTLEPSEDNRIDFENCREQLTRSLVDGGLSTEQSVSLVDALVAINRFGLWL